MTFGLVKKATILRIQDVALLLNWFRLELSVQQLNLPRQMFASWEDSTTAKLDPSNQGIAFYREQSNTSQEVIRRSKGEVAMFAFAGPSQPTGWKHVPVDLWEKNDLAAMIIERSIRNYFVKRGAQVHQSRWSSLATRPVDFEHPGIILRTGVSFKSFQPEGERQRGLSLQWEVKAEFRHDLTDKNMAKLALGSSVILRLGEARKTVESSLLRFDGRFVGVVQQLFDKENAEVLLPDRTVHRVPRRCLFLEVKTDKLREFEALMRVPSHLSAWQKIQELSLALTRNRRRNTALFRDRLRAIRDFIAPVSQDFAVAELFLYEGGQLNLDLRPTTINLETAK